MTNGQYYIHYHYINYLRYGIESSKKNTADTNKVSSYLANRHQEFLQKIQKEKKQSLDITTIRQYETLYKQLLNPSLAKDTVTEQLAIKGHQEIERLTREAYQKQFDQGMKISASGGVMLSPQDQVKKSIQKATSVKQSILNSIKLNEQNTFHKISTIEKAVLGVYTFAQQYMSSAGDDLNAAQIKNTVVALEEEINKLYSQTAAFAHTLNNENSNMQQVLQPCLELLANSSGRKGMIKHDIPLVNIVNTLIDLMKVAAVGNIIGDIGEYTALVTEAAISKGVSLAGDNLIEEINKLMISEDVLVGSKKEKANSVQKVYDLGSMFNIKSKDITVAITDSSSNSQSQTKIDVKFSNPHTQQRVGVSVKNYNLKSGFYVSLVGETPLSSLLAEEPEFAAHYLNIVNAHDYQLSEKGGPQVGGGNHSSMRHLANDALKMYSLLPALRGFTGRGQVEYLLVNDNSSAKAGSVKLINIYDLIEEVVLHRDLTTGISMKVGNKSIGALNKGSLWSNEWHGDKEKKIRNRRDADKRIATLLGQVHGAKVKVSIAPNILQKAMYGTSRF